jgi:hypothetical protein
MSHKKILLQKKISLPLRDSRRRKQFCNAKFCNATASAQPLYKKRSKNGKSVTLLPAFSRPRLRRSLPTTTVSGVSLLIIQTSLSTAKPHAVFTLPPFARFAVQIPAPPTAVRTGKRHARKTEACPGESGTRVFLAGVGSGTACRREKDCKKGQIK